MGYDLWKLEDGGDTLGNREQRQRGSKCETGPLGLFSFAVANARDEFKTVQPMKRGPSADCCADFASVIECDGLNDTWECPFCGFRWVAACEPVAPKAVVPLTHPCTRSGCGKPAPFLDVTQSGLATWLCSCGEVMTKRVDR